MFLFMKRLLARPSIRFTFSILSLFLLGVFQPGSCRAADPKITTISFGVRPYMTVVTQDSRYAYIGDSTGGYVYRVVLATASVDQSLNLGSSVKGLALTPDGTFLYAATSSGNVYKIDTSTLTVSDNIALSGSPWGVTIHPGGAYAYIAERYNHRVQVVDLSSKAVVATITGFDNPCGLQITPDGSFVYVANKDDTNVKKINTATNTVVATMGVGVNPWNPATGPNNAYVYVGGSSSSSVSVINVATDTVDQTVSVGTGPYCVDAGPNGEYFYAANCDDDTVYKINATTYVTETVYNVGRDPMYIVVSPNNRYIVTANYFGSGATIIDFGGPADGDGGTDPDQDPIPPGGPAHQLGGGGENIDPPLPLGHTWTPSGTGGTPQSLTMPLANLGGGAQTASGRMKRDEAIPGLMFSQTCPLGTVQEHWLALGETGTTPSGVEYSTGMRWNYDVRVMDLECTWPQEVIRSMTSGRHCLTYWLQTAEGLRSNRRVGYLDLSQETETASFSTAKTAPVPLSGSELAFKLQVSLFNQETGFVERISEGMCEVEVDGETYGTYPIVEGQLTAMIPFGQTCLIKFIAQEFQGYKRVRIEFKDGFMYAYDHDFRDAEVEVYKYPTEEAYAMEYYRDLVYICNQGEDPKGPILGRMFGK